MGWQRWGTPARQRTAVATCDLSHGHITTPHREPAIKTAAEGAACLRQLYCRRAKKGLSVSLGIRSSGILVADLCSGVTQHVGSRRSGLVWALLVHSHAARSPTKLCWRSVVLGWWRNSSWGWWWWSTILTFRAGHSVLCWRHSIAWSLGQRLRRRHVGTTHYCLRRRGHIRRGALLRRRRVALLRRLNCRRSWHLRRWYI